MAKLVVTARAIDMLGRQQVAGVPTAIHELFKNAHDADASRVEVDYWRKDALFLLRDDGVGMSRADFGVRWLTVGTDSKLETGPTASPPRKFSSTPRQVLGEKGIGRLAIATIGPLVLVLTKPRPEDASDGITAAMIHWALFEVPGLPIDQIEVPVQTCKRGFLPDADVLQQLRSGLANNASSIAGAYPFPSFDAVLRDVESFNIDLAALYAEADELRLDQTDASGTHFMIRPADRIIEADIDEEKDEGASPLRRTLLGFSNTMAPSTNPPTVRAAFRDHRTDGTVVDIIGDKNFFSPTLRDRLTRRINNASELGQLRLSVLRQRLAPTEADADDPIPNEELVAALEEQIEALREEVSLNLELAQVGMALGIVQHEFRSTVSNIRSAIKTIGPWAKANKGLLTPYAKLRSGFEHLDAYLGLFTPLDRRLHRRRTSFSGEQIATFLRNLFQARLDASSTEMIPTPGFVAYEVRVYPSTLLPVFANLVDNALHWISASEPGQRRIVLDVDGADLTVTDSGPGISARDAAFVFDFGFTRRDGGRGLGLYISRQVLRREGWDLILDAPESGRGARFRLVPPGRGDEGELEEE